MAYGAATGQWTVSELIRQNEQRKSLGQTGLTEPQVAAGIQGSLEATYSDALNRSKANTEATLGQERIDVAREGIQAQEYMQGKQMDAASRAGMMSTLVQAPIAGLATYNLGQKVGAWGGSTPPAGYDGNAAMGEPISSQAGAVGGGAGEAAAGEVTGQTAAAGGEVVGQGAGEGLATTGLGTLSEGFGPVVAGSIAGGALGAQGGLWAGDKLGVGGSVERKTAGGIIGGAAAGAGVGVWFGGFGAIPGAIIGGIVGGVSQYFGDDISSFFDSIF